MDARLKTEVRECTTRLGGILKEQLGSERFDTIETLRLASRQVRRHHRRKEIQFKRQFVKGLSQSRKEEKGSKKRGQSPHLGIAGVIGSCAVSSSINKALWSRLTFGSRSLFGLCYSNNSL